MATQNLRTGLLLGFLAYAAWGLLSPIGKLLLAGGEFLPLGLNAVRFLLATIIVLLLIGKDAVVGAVRLLAHPGVLWFNLLANGSLTLFLYSLTLLDATYATLGFYSAPLWTAAWAMLRLKENVGKWFVPAVAALLAGGYLALFGFEAPASVDAWGMTLATGSAIIWAFYTVALRQHAPGLALKPLMGASFIFGTVWYYGLALIFEGPPRLVGRDLEVWGWMAIYVIGPSLVSFVLFNAAMQRAPASLVNILVGAELGFTVLFSYLILHDTFNAAQLLGLGIVLFAVSLYLWSQRGQASSGKPT